MQKRIGGRPLVYFDSAATSQKPKAVLAAMDRFYRQANANVHRGLDPLGAEATRLYEAGRDQVASFLGAQREEIIFTRGATEGINLVARAWGETQLRSGDRVVISLAEHHSNIVPWLQLREARGIRVDFIPLKKDGRLDFAAARRLLSAPRVKLLALSQASNVLGLYHDLRPLLLLAKRRRIATLVDAAQGIAHRASDVGRLGCDFFVFSGHKIFGPTGTGVLYGRRQVLEQLPPYLGGGGMIAAVRTDGYIPAELPDKFEAGTPNIAGVIGLGAALAYVSRLGYGRIEEIEKELTEYFLARLSQASGVRLIGTGPDKLPVFSLALDGVHPHDAADLLGQEGIVTRAGQHCAQPLHDSLGIGATLRVSLSIYNSRREIDYFFKKLAACQRLFR